MEILNTEISGFLLKEKWLHQRFLQEFENCNADHRKYQNKDQIATSFGLFIEVFILLNTCK